MPQLLLDANRLKKIADSIPNQAIAAMIRDARTPAAQQVALMAERDPAGYGHAKMDRRRAFMAAQLQLNMLTAIKEGNLSVALNKEMRDLYQRNGLSFSQLHKGDNVPSWITDTTTGNEIATVAFTLLPLITRAVIENPIFELVETFVSSQPTVKIVYFDVEYGTAGGHYNVARRVDNTDDPTYSDRTDCTAAGKELQMRINSETASVTDKVLGGKICLTAQQDAQANYDLSLADRLGEWIQRLHRREWGRLVTNDLRTMAGNTGSWSATPPAPYSSLNTNEWRKVLVETCITVDSEVRKDVYEPTQWMLSDPIAGAILERVQRMHAPMATGNPMQTGVSLTAGEFGSFVERWKYFQDPYFAANTILMGRRSFDMVPNAPYYFIPYQWMASIAQLFYPLTQVLEMAAMTRCARKMIEPNAYGRVDITA